jgi:hypothetical protein
MRKMYKLIVNTLSDTQEIVEVGKTGGYFDKSKVVYDEREDGELTTDQISKVGGYTRQGDSLVFSQVEYDTNQTKINDELNIRINKKLKKKNGKIIAADKTKSVEQRLQGVIDYLGLE